MEGMRFRKCDLLEKTDGAKISQSSKGKIEVEFFSSLRVVIDHHKAGRKQYGSRTGMGGRSQCLGNGVRLAA